MRTGKPAYLILYESLRKEIAEGDRPFGARMPSRREMARERGLSVITVEHGYELLCQEGYIEARPRSGYYVIYRTGDGFAGGENAVLHRALVPVLSQRAARAEDVFPFGVLARTMRRVLSEYGEAVLERSPGQGMPELRGAISRYLARNRGIRVLPEQIVIGSGAEYLYGLVVTVLGRERIYAIEDPSYEKIEMVYKAERVACEPLALTGDGIDREALRNTSASVLHITPYRSYPTGVTASVSARRAYLNWAEAGDRYIVEDDFESEFSLLRKPEETLFARSDAQRVIYLNTFSKTVSPSMRVGYMVLPEKLLGAFSEKAGFYSCTVPTFEQYVLSELIDSGDFERHIRRIRRARRAQTEK